MKSKASPASGGVKGLKYQPNFKTVMLELNVFLVCYSKQLKALSIPPKSTEKA
jgi:hypothetical protein